MSPTPPVTVDVHSHLVPRGLVQAVRRRPVVGVSAESTEGRGHVFRSPDGSATRRLPDRLLDNDARNHTIDGKLGDPEAAPERLFFDNVVFDPSTLEFLVSRESDGSVLLGSDCPFPIGDPHPCRAVAETKLTETVKSGILGGPAMGLFGVRGDQMRSRMRGIGIAGPAWGLGV